MSSTFQSLTLSQQKALEILAQLVKLNFAPKHSFNAVDWGTVYLYECPRDHYDNATIVKKREITFEWPYDHYLLKNHKFLITIYLKFSYYQSSYQRKEEPEINCDTEKFKYNSWEAEKIEIKNIIINNGNNEIKNILTLENKILDCFLYEGERQKLHP